MCVFYFNLNIFVSAAFEKKKKKEKKLQTFNITQQITK